MKSVDQRHRQLLERVLSGELLSDQENQMLCDYESGQRGPEFQGFPKIPRLNREIIITEKIDGTNAQLYITEDGRVFPGSRNRWLTRFADNFGFAAWVWEHQSELRELGPGRHFGEWWGQGINRGYGLDHKRFSLFNVSRWANPPNKLLGILHPGREGSRLVPACCRVVPVLWAGHFFPDAIPHTIDTLRELGSAAAPGFKQPEGIVIYHTAGNYLFKVTLENDEKPKGENQ